MVVADSPREPRHLRADSVRRWSIASWLLLTLLSVAALCCTDSLPFYDYYQWLFQGHVVSVLLFGTDAGTGGISSSYFLSPVPVPNLAAPVLIGLLNRFLTIEVAGQVFVVVTALGFAAAFGHLVRTIQQRPTAIEFMGFPWAMGFFLYKGYLSYEFGVAWMFVLVALLHRLARRPLPGDPRTLLAVTGVGTLLYLSHLLAWLMGGTAVLAYAFDLVRRGHRRRAGQLVLCMTPGVVRAAWYLVAERGGAGVTLYPSWQDKAIAMTETFQFFLRLDPFPPTFPLLWVNALLALAFGALILPRLDLSRLRTAIATQPTSWLSTALAAVALVLPISTVNDLIKPDERFVAPAVLLAIAAAPYRVGRFRVTGSGAALAAVAISLHLVEYVDVGQRIAQVDTAIDTTVPGDASVLHLAIASRHGCGTSAGPVTGVPVLKWFAVDHTLEGGPAGVNVEETSLVHTRSSAALDTTVLALDVPEVPTVVLPTAFAYRYIEVIACASDLEKIERSLAPAYEPASRGDAYAILKRT